MCDICWEPGEEYVPMECSCIGKRVCLDCLMGMELDCPCPFCRASSWGDYRAAWLRVCYLNCLLSQILAPAPIKMECLVCYEAGAVQESCCRVSLCAECAGRVSSCVICRTPAVAPPVPSDGPFSPSHSEADYPSEWEERGSSPDPEGIEYDYPDSDDFRSDAEIAEETSSEM